MFYKKLASVLLLCVYSVMICAADTLETLVIPDATPPALSAIVVNPTEIDATIEFTTDENATTSIAYGLTDSYELSTVTGPLSMTHSVNIPSITCGTTYHYQVTTTNELNNTAQSSDQTFVTANCPVPVDPPAPSFDPAGGSGFNTAGTNTAFCSTVIGAPAAECEALMNIYDTMGGINWNFSQGGRWGESTFICGMWAGVTCANGHVTGVSRSYKNLVGDFHITEGNLNFLTTLNISNNTITSFSADELPSLQDLRIYGNNLTDFPTTGLSGLTYLNAENNNLTTFDGTNFGNLVTLRLNFNALITFSGTGLTSLKNLYLQSNILTTFFSTGMPVLDYLRLDSNQFTTFSGTGLGVLTELSLIHNNLVSFIHTGFDSLLRLNLEDNDLTSFVGTGLETLTDLYMQYNDLVSFDGVGMYDLVDLDIYENEIVSFDGAQLNSLESMRIYNNLLTEFDGIGMENLTTLELNNNLLTTFDGSMLNKLEYLRLFENQLTTFSAVGMGGLYYLDLWNNNLTTFDVTGLIGWFERVDVSNNFLTTLPTEISELTIDTMGATENCFVRTDGLLPGTIITWLDSFLGMTSWETLQPRGCSQPEPEPVTVTCEPSATSALTGAPISWTAVVAGGTGNYTYEWTGDDGLTGTDNPLAKTYSTIGVKTASVTVSSGVLSSEPTACTETTITAPPSPVTVTCEPSATSALTGESITWTAVATGGNSADYTYEWTGTDDLIGTDNPLVKNYTTTGVKSATVVATEGGSPSVPFTCSTTISAPPSGGGGGGGNTTFSYGCTDPKALNFKKNVLSRSSMCEYPPAPPTPNIPPKLDSAPIETTLCSAKIYPTKYIRLGGKNDPAQVTLLEQYLTLFEGEKLPIDSIYSQDDANAVIRWQEKYRSEILTPWKESQGTGYVFITSLRKFRELFEVQCNPDNYTAPKPSTYLTRDLKLGMEGEDVKKLQEILITKATGPAAKDLASVGATGYFGPKTKFALAEFQKSRLLNPANGEMGIITIFLLMD